jgi:predicted hydrocarbon binding protein
VTCSGLSPVGRTLCHFEGGLIAGVVETILGKPVQAKEVSCIGGLGDSTCGFDLQVRDTGQTSGKPNNMWLN